MKLTTIDYQDVERNNLELPHPANFNTSFHTEDEAPDLVRPSETPCHFKRWLPLMLRTRNLSSTASQIITLSRSQATLLLETTNGSIQRGAVNMMYAEDIEDEIIPTLAALSFPPEGLFVRFEACSPKDGAQTVRGRRSLHTVDEIILRLVTSLRARNALSDALESGASQVELFFVQLNPRLQTNREYRAFCPPGGQIITGVSQYQWHAPWLMASRQSPEEFAGTARRIVHGIESLHGQVLEELQPDDEVDRLILSQGFTFDVFFDEEDGACQLVELNTFGVRSARGSCLFQRVRDRAQLYGTKPELEFRITVPYLGSKEPSS